MQRKQSPAFCLSGYLDNRAEGFPDIRQTWHGSGGSIYFLISEKGFAKIPTEKKTLYMELNVENKKEAEVRKEIQNILEEENKRRGNVSAAGVEDQCKLRSNGMPVPLLRNCYSIFNGTKYR